MTSSLASKNKLIKSCDYYQKIQCKGWGGFDQIRSLQTRNCPKSYNTFFTVPLLFSMSKSFPFYFFFFPICTYQLLSSSSSYVFWWVFPLLWVYFFPYCFPPSFSVSLAFFSVSLLSLSTLSFFAIYTFPHLNQSLCRNQVDVFKWCYICYVEFMLLADFKSSPNILYDFKGNYKLVVF